MKLKHCCVAVHVAFAGAAALSASPACASSIFDTPEYRRQEGLALINAAEAYSLGYSGLGVTVGVLDSGIAAMHPEFSGKVAGGYDFILGRAVSERNGIDTDGHGSHVNGIIGARRDGAGMHGVAYNARLFSVRYDDESDVNEDDERALAAGWNYLASQRLAVINNSLGYNDCDSPGEFPCNVNDYTAAEVEEKYPLTVEAFKRVAESGALMVFATGNESQPNADLLGGAPHLFEELKNNWLAVTSISVDGQPTDYANHCGVAKDWCLAAPGGGDDEPVHGVYSVNYRGGYIRHSGTSMATPHVAGAAAVVKEAFPYFGAYHLQQTLLTTATDLGAPGVDPVYGWGLLNLGKAVRGPAQFVSLFDVDTQGYDSTFSNDISGDGGLTKRGAGVLRLTGTNSYKGLSTVAGGKLVVNGTQASAVRVEPAGTLGGNGRIAAVDNYGTVAPGNSVGTLTVAGDYVARPGSVFEVEVDGNGVSDRLAVNGHATLAGTLKLEGELFRQDVAYSFITADGGISGRFDTIDATTTAFLAPGLKYGNTVTLQLERNEVPFSRYLNTSNQHAVGAVLDAGSDVTPAGMSAVYDAILNDDGSGMPAVMDQLSGEVHASTQSALMSTSSVVQRTLEDRMRGNVGAGMLPGAPVAQSAGALPAGAMPASSAYPLWAQVVGNWNTLKGNNNAAQAKTHVGGLFIGGDAGLDQGWRIGAALGFTDGRTSVDDRSSRADLASYTAALYGGKSWKRGDGQLNLLAGAAYTRHNIDSRRRVAVGGSQTLKADYHANTAQLFTELGYAFPVGAASRIEPYAGVAWLDQRASSFNESGGEAALHGDKATDQLTTFTLGLRGKTAVEMGRHAARLTAGAGWRHAAGDVTPERRLSFLHGALDAFNVAGAPIAKNAALLDLGAEVDLGKRSAMGLSYSGQFGQGNTDHAGSLYLKVRF
ncbi:autotransporter domain-containing protein [Parapusillimonas sp. SGNA-6]|nr:autotransporter domain-containing protein [Parapusillimonas sp. SGNA-6]